MTSSHPQHGDVALRKESVDRNQNTKPTKQAKAVALRKESVDRNKDNSVIKNNKE